MNGSNLRRVARWSPMWALVLMVAGAGSARAADADRNAALRAEADSAYARQDWKQAAKAYERLSKVTPEAVGVWHRLGASRAGLEQWDGAVEAYRKADALSPNPPLSRYNMACAFARGGRRDSALTALEVVVNRGYRQADAILADTDFESLRGEARFAAAVEQARKNATPCAYRPEARQFDFWIGEWDVFDRQRNMARAGSSRIEEILGQCVLLENWSGSLGGNGKSFNIWNPATSCWQQTWVSDGGNVTYFNESRIEDKTIIFLADGQTPAGKPLKNRLSFTPLGPDEVRQFGEFSTDGGQTWSVGYDFLYRRRR